MRKALRRVPNYEKYLIMVSSQVSQSLLNLFTFGELYRELAHVNFAHFHVLYFGRHEIVPAAVVDINDPTAYHVGPELEDPLKRILVCALDEAEPLANFGLLSSDQAN